MQALHAAPCLDATRCLQALLEEALSALDLSRAEVAHAAHEAQCARAGARVLRESLFVRDASALLQSDRLQHAHQEVRPAACTRAAWGSSRVSSGGRAQHTHTLSGEHAETEYSLISTAVETTDLRRELHLTQRKLGASRLPAEVVHAHTRRSERDGRHLGAAHKLRHPDAPASGGAGAACAACARWLQLTLPV